MAGVNKVILIGNVGKAPESKRIPSGKLVVTFSLATSEKRGEETYTEWHNIVLWEKTAEIAERYVVKGSKLYVEGKIVTRSWDGTDGQKKYRTEIVGYNIQMLGERQESRPAAPAALPEIDVNADVAADDSDLPF